MLADLITQVEATRSQLTLYHVDESVRAELAETFADRNLDVAHSGITDDSKDGFAVFTRDGEFIDATSTAELLGDSTPVAPGFDADRYRAVLDHVDETLFTSYSTARMVAASREIEDRAWRRGDGELHACFQTLDVFSRQADVYSTLAQAPRLEVHAYAAPEGAQPDCSDVTLHVADEPELRNSWFVVYDGAGRAEDACLLLAEERSDGSFSGFWSYDPDTVEEALEYIRSAYDGERHGEGTGTRV